jgi:lipopolysaccharide biosynthesis glycosyltransferase
MLYEDRWIAPEVSNPSVFAEFSLVCKFSIHQPYCSKPITQLIYKGNTLLTGDLEKTQKKRNAVVFGLTADHIFAVACVMMDLKRIVPGLIDEVVIIHDGVSLKDQMILESILPSRFILYDFPLKSKKVLQAPSVLHFTKMIFTKFECLRLLDNYNNVAWMDYDIVIQSDMSELFSPSNSGFKIARGGVTVREQLIKPVAEYNMNAEGMGAHVFVVQDNLKKYTEMYRFCYTKLEEYAQVLFLPEQAIFDFMIQEFGVKPDFFDARVYGPHPRETADAMKAKIIHCWGQPKFWNGTHNVQWNANYSSWIKMGGSKYKAPTLVEKLWRKLKKIMH